MCLRTIDHARPPATDSALMMEPLMSGWSLWRADLKNAAAGAPERRGGLSTNGPKVSALAKNPMATVDQRLKGDPGVGTSWTIRDIRGGSFCLKSASRARVRVGNGRSVDWSRDHRGRTPR